MFNDPDALEIQYVCELCEDWYDESEVLENNPEFDLDSNFICENCVEKKLEEQNDKIK